MKILLSIGAAVGVVGLFLLATASADTSLMARQYPLLLGLNAALALLLAAFVIYQLVLLARRYRARVFGTRLTLRLVARFALLAVVPGLVVYAVSVVFITRSIESWFDVKVDAALEGGMRLGQGAIDQMQSELQAKARAMALDLAERSPTEQVLVLNRLREQASVQDAVLVGNSGRLVASASEDLTRFVPELPTPQALRQARLERAYSSIDSPAGKGLAIRVVLPVDRLVIGDELRYLQLRQSVPESFARSAEAVEAAYRDYRELALSRDGLKQIYVVTLTFALLMALFAAVAVAVNQSNLLSQPMANLAQATQAVARGDFSHPAPVTSRDEIGVLTESFNSMMRQLDEARKVVEANRLALETAKAYLENILGNLSTGVLVFDQDLSLSVHNLGANTILGTDFSAVSGRPLQEWAGSFEPFAKAVREAFMNNEDKPWQLEFSPRGTGKTLLARGAPLPRENGAGHVLVFDDVTQLIQAQRATAWAEVARRLAHEIKNPLTPIQLSAERLDMKLSPRLGEEDAETLHRSTRTIVNQVAALKAMVDDFSDYARIRAPVLTGLDLNALVIEVLSLYENSRVPVSKFLAPDLAPVRADSAQMRQVIHNLVQNAQDALEQNELGGVLSDSAILVETSDVGDRIRLCVSDQGGGFPEETIGRAFEPYVTTKPRGTGLGLAIVKKIVDEHQGSIEIRNRPGEGAAVLVFLQKVNGAAKPSLVRGALQTDDTSAAVRPARSA